MSHVPLALAHGLAWPAPSSPRSGSPPHSSGICLVIESECVHVLVLHVLVCSCARMCVCGCVCVCPDLTTPASPSQLTLTNTASFAQALQAISSTLHVGLVEQIEESASLYGCSISNHHVCLLVKGMVSGPEGGGGTRDVCWRSYVSNDVCQLLTL